MTLGKVLSAAALLLSVSHIQAGQIGKEKDWTLDDYTTSDGVGVCVAATTIKVKKANYRLEIQRSKTKAAATEILIREQSYSYGESGFTANPASVTNGQIAFAKMDETADARFFWLVPAQTNNLLNGLARGVELRVYAVNPTEQIKFSFSPKGFETKSFASAQH